MSVDIALTIIPITVVAYLATNLDNFLLLVTMLGQYRTRSSAVFAGFFICMAVLAGGGFLLGEAAARGPINYIGYLGVLPITLGLIGFWKLWRGGGPSEGVEKSARNAWGAVLAATFLTQVGNGGDTLITFGALFADTAHQADLLIIGTLAATAVSIAWLANYTLSPPGMSAWIDRYADKISPFILIAIGVYILADTASDVV